MAVELKDNALTTIEAVKEYLQIDATDTSKDNLLGRLINAASSFIERYCDRKFAKGIYTEKYRGTGSQNLYLNQRPVNNVVYVKIDGQTIDSGEYELIPDAGILYRETGWPCHGYTQDLTGDFVISTRNIEVQYEAGYILPKDGTTLQPANLPDDVEQACIMLVMFYYKTDVANFSTVFAESGAVFKPQAMPSNVKVLLDQYRRLSC